MWRCSRPGFDGIRVSGEYVLNGLFWCCLCQQQRRPALNQDGQRCYTCGPGCDQPDTDADWVEQHAALHALVRSASALHGTGEHHRSTADMPLPVSGHERRQWAQTDVDDHHALIHTAYTRIEIDEHSDVRHLWRQR